jgi:hypothetical protein
MFDAIIGRVGVETEYRGDVMVVLCVAFTSGEVQHQGKCIGHSPALAYPCILHDRLGGKKGKLLYCLKRRTSRNVKCFADFAWDEGLHEMKVEFASPFVHAKL